VSRDEHEVEAGETRKEEVRRMKTPSQWGRLDEEGFEEKIEKRIKTIPEKWTNSRPRMSWGLMISSRTTEY